MPKIPAYHIFFGWCIIEHPHRLNPQNKYFTVISTVRAISIGGTLGKCMGKTHKTEWKKKNHRMLILFWNFYDFYLQQVDDKYIRTIYLHSSGGSISSAGKNSHRSKTLTNSQSRDRFDASGASRARSLASQPSGHGEYIYTGFFFLFKFYHI